MQGSPKHKITQHSHTTMPNVPSLPPLLFLACLFPNHDNIIITVPISITVTIGNGNNGNGINGDTTNRRRRCCFLCKTTKSPTNSRGTHIWYLYGKSRDFHICANCYQMERRVPARKDVRNARVEKKQNGLQHLEVPQRREAVLWLQP